MKVTGGRKGYITSEDLKAVFGLLGNEVSDEELTSKWRACVTGVQR